MKSETRRAENEMFVFGGAEFVWFGLLFDCWLFLSS